MPYFLFASFGTRPEIVEEAPYGGEKFVFAAI